MTYYSKREYKLLGYEKATRKNKMYNAILQNRKTGQLVRVPFGSTEYENYQDKTGLNLYPHLIHGDKKRKKLYIARHKKDLKAGYYSPGYFSYFILW